jgi:pimeloyl-ACP methyl ester carboxylesterase
MPYFDHGDTRIYYEEHGDGFPLLLLAPGGMNSTVDAWARVQLNPIADYAGDFRLIAMDQRNAGRSAGPLDATDPWGSYAGDSWPCSTTLASAPSTSWGAASVAPTS